MTTNQVKKVVVSTLKEQCEIHISSRKSLRDILDEYIQFIAKEIPSGFEHYFGIGIAGSHSQFGDHWGFESDEFESHQTIYCVPGSSYHIANDWNAKVRGSSFEAQLAFAERIPDLIKGGIEVLKEKTTKADEISKKVKALFE